MSPSVNSISKWHSVLNASSLALIDTFARCWRFGSARARSRALPLLVADSPPLHLHLLAPGSKSPANHAAKFSIGLVVGHLDHAESGRPGACDGAKVLLSSAPATLRRGPIAAAYPTDQASPRAIDSPGSRTLQSDGPPPTARSCVETSLLPIDKPSKRPSPTKMEIRILTRSV